MDEQRQTLRPAGATVSRRTLGRAAVWSVPVVASVVAAPTAWAASGDPRVTITPLCLGTSAARGSFTVSIANNNLPVGSSFVITSDAALTPGDVSAPGAAVTQNGTNVNSVLVTTQTVLPPGSVLTITLGNICRVGGNGATTVLEPVLI